MEIERKYLIRELPERLEQYPCRQIEQGYLNTTLSCASAAPTNNTL